MTWKDDLATGVKEIDFEHKQLCDAIDRLLDACKVGKGRTEVINTMNFLFEYTKKHFANEELIQKKVGYPKIEEHKKLHNDFVNELRIVKDDIVANGVGITTIGQLNNLLAGWLINHIKKTDKEIALYSK